MDDERDACALVAVARKDGAAMREVLAETIRGLECLAHRSGSIDGEGDGSGVLTDIPRELWADALKASRLDPSLRSEEHTSELQSQFHLVCRLLLEKKKTLAI